MLCLCTCVFYWCPVRQSPFLLFSPLAIDADGEEGFLAVLRVGLEPLLPRQAVGYGYGAGARSVSPFPGPPIFTPSLLV